VYPSFSCSWFKDREVRPLRRVMSFLGERGVTSIEYAIIAAAIAMGIILAVTAIGNQVGSVYTDMGSSFPK
jgi:Flp pilus assembly pilin Flp